MRIYIVTVILSLFFAIPALAQDPTPTLEPFDPEAIPNFGAILLTFDIPMDNRDFLLGKWIATQPDLSRIYVGSGVSGIVYIFDEKGRLLDEVDTIYEFPPTDMVVGADGNLYIVQGNNVYIYDRDGQRVGELDSFSMDDVIFSRVAPLEDKTVYVADFFNV